VTIDGGTLGGLGSLAGATDLSGSGTVSIALSTGTGTITASGGTLTLSGLVSGRPLQIATAATLLRSGHAASPTSVTSQGAAGTLEVDSTASLTVANQFAISTDTVKLDGATSTLTDTNGVTIAGGTLSGSGTLGATTMLSGSG